MAWGCRSHLHDQDPNPQLWGCGVGQHGWGWPSCQPRMVTMSSTPAPPGALASPATVNLSCDLDWGNSRTQGTWGVLKSGGDLPEVTGLMFSPSWRSRNLIVGHPPCPRGEYVEFLPGVCGTSGRGVRESDRGTHAYLYRSVTTSVWWS